MANRRRGTFSLPEELQTTETILTKKEAALRRSAPPCPRVPCKLRRHITRTGGKAKPLFFERYAELSVLYDTKLNSSYFEQLFFNQVLIGEGSFGKVYHCTSHEDGRTYAVKRLKSVISFKDRYAEVRNNEKIGFHPNIVQFFMAWEESCSVYMLLEYCDLSLSDFGLLDTIIGEELVWTIIHDIAKALMYLHGKNLIHLDVKPSNIMMKDGYFKLTDFGILVEITSSPTVCKTLSDGDSKYLAIEVLDGIYKPACDIFGLGISLLELVGNFELPSSGPLWHQLRHNILPKAFYSNPEIALGFKVLIERMLRPEYNLRPTAKDLLRIPNVKDVAKADKMKPRVDFAAQVLLERGFEDLPFFRLNNNNIVTGTPPPVASEFNRVDLPDYIDFREPPKKEEFCLGRKALFPEENAPEYEDNTDSSCLSGLDILPDDTIDIDPIDIGVDEKENSGPITSTPILRVKPQRRSLKKYF